MIRLVSAALALLLAACVDSREISQPFVVNVSRASEGCDISVDGKQISSAALLRLTPGNKRQRVIVVAGVDAPYKCVGGAIITLQHAGFAHIDFATWNPG